MKECRNCTCSAYCLPLGFETFCKNLLRCTSCHRLYYDVSTDGHKIDPVEVTPVCLTYATATLSLTSGGRAVIQWQFYVCEKCSGTQTNSEKGNWPEWLP